MCDIAVYSYQYGIEGILNYKEYYLNSGGVIQWTRFESMSKGNEYYYYRECVEKSQCFPTRLMVGERNV